jgi:nicotinamide mononucleotide transporter
MAWIEPVAVILAIGYLLLAIAQKRACWVAALISSVLFLVLFADAKLYMESALQVVYAVMAILGWIRWQSGDSGQRLAISSRPRVFHAACILSILGASWIVGYLMSQYTDAARPFIDAATTVAALVTTWMVVEKIIENWLYWIVINSVSVWLFFDRNLDMTAFLFLVYILLSFVGYLFWRRQLPKQF